MKVCVVGGGSSYEPELLDGFFTYEKELNVDEIHLLDVEEGKKKLEVVTEFAKRMAQKRNSKVKILSTLDVKDAMSNADFVIFQFRPGFLDGRERDEKIPLAYNLIGQETTGMGGFAAALRGFPIMEKYIEAVRKYAPNAFVVNFTNPSGHMSEFVINYLEFEKFVGLCNIPINLIQYVADFFNASRDEVFLKYYGLNHLSFVEKVFVKGDDRTEKLLDDAKEKLAEEGYPEWIVDVLNMYPNSYLRYYLMTDTMLAKEKEELKEGKLRSMEVKRIEKKLFEIYSDPKTDEKPAALSERGGAMYSTAAVELIRDMVSGRCANHVLNVRNNGAVKNLPDDYVMELSCQTVGKNVFPVTVGDAQPFAVGLITTIKMYERLTIEAYKTSSKSKALQAILLHPLGPRLEKAREFLDDVLEVNKGWIKELN